MTVSKALTPASELARRSKVRFPNESEAYRRAREALLAEEIELRRHIEQVAELRRALPPGGKVVKDYRFEGEHGPVGFADLFGDKQTLVIYNYMFGPQRERPCPMCTSLLERLGRRGARHRATHRARGNCAFAGRAPRRVQEGARLAQPQTLLRRHG